MIPLRGSALTTSLSEKNKRYTYTATNNRIAVYMHIRYILLFIRGRKKHTINAGIRIQNKG